MNTVSSIPSFVRAVASLACIVALAGCDVTGINQRGETCGGAQTASARVTLPDTGIAAGTQVLVVLSQFDPFLIGEETEITVQHLWPASRGTDTEANPRVRLVRDDGRVLLDTLSSRSIPNDGDPSRLTWIVYRRTQSAELRNAMFEALRDQKVTLELWRAGATGPGTVARLTTESAVVSSVLKCL